MAIIFDLEATCEEPKTERFESEIIEIGAVKETGEEFQAFVRPATNCILSDFCRQLTNIKQEDVDKAETCDLVIRKFMEFVGNDVLYSWGAFDRKLLTKECERYIIDWKFEHGNLKLLYAQANKMKRERGMKKVLEREGIKLEGTHHRALDDAKNLLKIFKLMKERKQI